MRDFVVFFGYSFAMACVGGLILWGELHLSQDEPLTPIDEDPRPRWRRWLTTLGEGLAGLGVIGCLLVILGLAKTGVDSFPPWIGTLIKLWFGAVMLSYAYQLVSHHPPPSSISPPPAPDPPAQTGDTPDP